MLRTYATHFASIGGACCGIEQAGLKCVHAVEYMEDRVAFRKKNLGHEATCANMAEYKPAKSHAADLLWTSPPCTALSSAAREYVDLEDPRNKLYLGSLEYCKKLRPKYFILENVMGILTHKSDKMGGNTLVTWRKDFEKIGYYTEYNVLNSKYFGVPQDRERVFMVGSLEGKTGLIPAENLQITKTFQDIMEMGSAKECYPEQSYWTVLKCLARNSAKNKTPYRWAIVGRNSLFEGHLGDDGKPEPLDPYQHNILPTLTCSFDGGPTRKKCSVIDEKDGITYLRHPTVREGARAQGFPDHWEWPESTTLSWNYIGDAVTSSVSKAIVEHLIKVEAGERPKAKTELNAKRIAKYLAELQQDILSPLDFGTGGVSPNDEVDFENL